MTNNPNTPGIGLRLAHLAEMVATRPTAGWLEHRWYFDWERDRD